MQQFLINDENWYSRSANKVESWLRTLKRKVLGNENWWLGALYFFLALPLVIFLCFEQPVFQVPDEPNHFFRAYQVAQGNWFPQKVMAEGGRFRVGGLMDEGVFQVIENYRYLMSAPDKRVDAQLAQAAADVGWGVDWGNKIWIDAPNVSNYPPFLYLVSAAGIGIGKAFNLSITETLHLARVLNGSVALVVASIAILVAEAGGVVLFALLLLPMVLGQFASVSQDALLIAFSALCAVSMAKAFRHGSVAPTWGYTVLSIGLLTLISMARPPYIALSGIFLLFALLVRRPRWARSAFIGAFGLSFLAVALWALYVAKNVTVEFGPPGISFEGQLQYIVNNPFQTVWVLIASVWAKGPFYIESFIANLGWLDTPFPNYYHNVAWLALGAVMALEFLRPVSDVDWKEWFVLTGGTVLVLVGTLFGILLVQYVTWTPVGGPIVEGVQGRYLIPLSFFVILTLIRGTPRVNDISEWLQRGATIVAAVYAVLTLMTVPWVIGIRYY